MGGYIKKQKTKFIHQDDACPSNSGERPYVCSSYNATTRSIDTGMCNYHRSADSSRSLTFAQYGPGSVIDHIQPKTLRDSIKTELDRRRMHAWYSGKLQNLSGSDVQTRDLIEHSQENVINNCISALNGFINAKPDYKYAKDSTVNSHKVNTGNIISAENLKYLERNLQAAYRDCICYSDCTMHGLSSWTERVWCSFHGSGGGY